MEQMPLNNPGSVPRLQQCFICKAWRLEKDLKPVEVPDQGNSYVQKLACQECLKKCEIEETVK